jgi:hypothetical protein
MTVIKRIGREGCPTGGKIVTDHPIAASVGTGGGNIRGDVKTIQQLLNAVPPLAGGPSKILLEDGLIGPKTQEAIAKYQKQVLGWSDGRIDPQGPTIGKLTQYIVGTPAVPYGKLGAPQSGSPGAAASSPGPAPSTLGADSIAVARICMRVLEPRLNLLRWKLTHGYPTMMALLNKHFAHHKENVLDADVAHIQKILAGIHRYIARFNAFGILPLDNVILFSPAPAGNLIAWTVRGGDKMSTSQIQIYEDHGVVSKNPGQSIWLTSLFADQPSHEKHWTVLHEFCHFVGPRDGFFTAINDNAYAFESNFLSLSKFSRLHNAESLSLFFLECCLGTDAIARLPRLKSVLSHFNAFPKVVMPSGDIVMS